LPYPVNCKTECECVMCGLGIICKQCYYQQ
uniref:Neurotoxin BmK A3-6 n=1 Tax=Olivierus martensii TaxID=34649 RepID=SCK6_OLIMR|nr:RecName: Full=Neurotoxin BmK A3-6 [Mesobuthus martensii]